MLAWQASVDSLQVHLLVERPTPILDPSSVLPLATRVALEVCLRLVHHVEICSRPSIRAYRMFSLLLTNLSSTRNAMDSIPNRVRNSPKPPPHFLSSMREPAPLWHVPDDLRLTQNSIGFGSNTNNSSSIFGASKPATGGFGTTNNSGGLFGGSSNTTNAGFGSGSTFGSNSSTGGVFGSGTSSTGGFGFGSGSNNNTSAFGTNQQKSLFGANGTGTTGGFGTGSGGFSNSTALNNVPPPQGTNVVPFNPTTEKEANGSISKYETITFQDPYKPYSLEELRLADYNGGRQFGTGTGGTGAFGQSNFGNSTFTGNTTAFGGNTGSSIFGSNNNTTTSSPFGTNTATSGAFGSNNTGSSLFGSNQSKPGGLFGASSSSAPSGGLFSTTTNNNSTTTGGFGFGSNNNTGSSLFGNNNSTQNQTKPSIFGSTSNASGNTGGFSFSSPNNNSGGFFGNNNNNSTSNTTGGIFGNNNNSQQQTGTGTSLFNNNQNQNTGGLFSKPANAFGSTTQNQGGGLFGSNNTANTGSNIFGSNTNNQTSGGGLFGNTGNANSNTGGGIFGNQNKTGGLFGNNTSNTTGSIFGGNNANTATSGSGLFSNNNAGTSNAQSSGSLFGGTTTNTGGSIFGNNQNKGIFGNSTTTNNQGTSIFGGSMNSGLFNQSQNNQQNPQQQEVKHASLLDPNPYGQSSIWTGLPQPTPENSKPLFTPLTATKKMQESAMKPISSLRLNQSRYNTPPRRNGYGFSYSTYGTPNSATSTPGGASLSSSMYGNRGFSGGSFGRSFNRSASVQNLRSYYASDSDDIWKPNAFAPSHRNSSGSIKRLTIDRSIRQDLFSRPQMPALPAPKSSNSEATSSNATSNNNNAEPPKRLHKRVSFENTVQETSLNSASGTLVRTEQDSDEETTPPRAINGATEPARSHELQAVPEDRESHQVSSKPTKANPQSDQTPGAYWMKPSRSEIAKMPREQKRAFKNFQVGRNGCGFINFDAPVDLESLNLDDVFGNIVNLSIRSVTVYPDPSTKPIVGKGLNVASTIELENSWPRNKGQLSSETSGRHYEQHIKRLKKMEGTDFISYDSSRGIWKFHVPHYTTYGLDYDDDDEGMDQSELSLPPSSLENPADASVMEVDDHTDSNEEDDTFAFRRTVPGQFTKQSIMEDDSALPADDEVQQHSDDGSDCSMVSEEDMVSDGDDMSPIMPGYLPQAAPDFSSPTKAPPRSAIPGTPGKPLLDLEGDWAEQLERTISPRKQNRDLLREAQSKVLLDKNFSPLKPKAATKVNFKSSIDIMNSIFLPATGEKTTKAAQPDFEV